MKKIILFFVFLVLASQSFAQDINKFVGQWTYESVVFLTISQKNNVLNLESPENSTWRSEFQNIRIEEGVLKFEQINYMIDDSFKEQYGTDHPYSGVVNYSEIWESEEGEMVYRLWTDYMEAEPPVVITRLMK
ncbi:hypothetical protein MNBD_BACTEROID05-646 [hydrothermal vent metagenome]|uniref:Uncharacterized protein n=1 Tax=hydrothermal vent metagenome TaxID=652676 RepID=A0A3B0UEY5_9ZZZZ